MIKCTFLNKLQVGLLSIFILGGLCSAQSGGYDQKHLAILSRLQSMALGTYTEKEWNQVTGQLDEILAETKSHGQWNSYVETQIIRANVLSMRSDDSGALNLLNSILSEFDGQNIPAVKKVYREIAAVYSRQGNEQGVVGTMKKFRESRYYDGETYSFSGGSSPSEPIIMPRPKAATEDSISMTAMQVQRTQAHYASGRQFPDFSTTDWDGRSLSLSDFHGKVLLVDFWTSGWFIWNRDLLYRKSVYDRHHPAGFEIVGFCLDPDKTSSRTFVRNNEMPWPQANNLPELNRKLGLFGESSNFLLDRNGTIIGRDLYGSELESAVRNALQK